MSFTNRFFKWAGVLALVVCAALTVTGCNIFGGDDGDDSGPVLYTIKTDLDIPVSSGTASLVAKPLSGATVKAVVFDGANIHEVALTESSTGQYSGLTSVGTVRSIVIHATSGKKVLRNMVVSPSLAGSIYNCGVTNSTTTGFVQMMGKLVGISDDGTLGVISAGFFQDSLTRKFTVDGVQQDIVALDTAFGTGDSFLQYREFWAKAIANADSVTESNVIVALAKGQQVDGKTADELHAGYGQKLGNWVGLTDFFFNGIAGVIDNNDKIEGGKVYRTITVNLPPSVSFNGIVKYTLFGGSVCVTSVNNAAQFLSGAALDLSTPQVMAVYDYGVVYNPAAGLGATTPKVQYYVRAVRGTEAAPVEANAATSQELAAALASSVQVINLTAAEGYEYDLSGEPVQWIIPGGAATVGNKKLVSANAKTVIIHGNDAFRLIGNPDLAAGQTILDPDGNTAYGGQITKSDNVKIVLAAYTGLHVYTGLMNTNITAGAVVTQNNNVNYNRINEIRLMNSCVYNPNDGTAGANTPVIVCYNKVINLAGHVLTGLKVQLGQLGMTKSTLSIISDVEGTASASFLASRVAQAGTLRSANITGVAATNPAAANSAFTGLLDLSNEVVLDFDAGATTNITLDNVEVNVYNVAQLEKILEAAGVNAAAKTDAVKLNLLGTGDTYTFTKNINFDATREGYLTPHNYAFEIAMNGKTLNLGGYSFDISRTAAADAGYALKLSGTGTLKNGIVLSTKGANYLIASEVTTISTDGTTITLPKDQPNTKIAEVTDYTTLKAAVDAKTGTIIVANDIDCGDVVVTFNTKTTIYSKGDVVKTVTARNFVSAYNPEQSKNFVIDADNDLVRDKTAAVPETLKIVYLQAKVSTEAQLKDVFNSKAYDSDGVLYPVANKLLVAASIELGETLEVSGMYAVAGATGVKLSPAAITVSPLVQLNGYLTNPITTKKEVTFSQLTFAASTDSATGTHTLFVNNIGNGADTAVKAIFENATFSADVSVLPGTVRYGYYAVKQSYSKFTNCTFKGFTGFGGYAVYLNGNHNLSGSQNNSFQNNNYGIYYLTNFIPDPAAALDIESVKAFMTDGGNAFTGGFGPATMIATATASDSTHALRIYSEAIAFNGADFANSGTTGFVSGIEYSYAAFVPIPAGATQTQVFSSDATTTSTIDATADGNNILTFKLPKGKSLVLTPRQISNVHTATAPTLTSATTDTKGNALVTYTASGNLTITPKATADTTTTAKATALFKVVLSTGTYLFQVQVD
ncbi:MAG: hypothetical protein HQM10_10210 [Candidatus Riflebacteria bacterium]|nr:hypothetical protein [Candidatus Riflebacteria bacterium]